MRPEREREGGGGTERRKELSVRRHFQSCTTTIPDQGYLKLSYAKEKHEAGAQGED